MDVPQQQGGIQKMKEMLTPWHESLAQPAAFQRNVLKMLCGIYSQSKYGAERHSAQIETVADFRQAFPVCTYEDYLPMLKKVMGGNTGIFLNEEPVGWAITRGTTKGDTKFIPMTPTDLKMRVSAGRAVLNFALSEKKFELFQGVNLNLNFPSRVGTVRAGEREVEYGYSSGIYTKHVSTLTPVRSVPSQDEIDALGGGRTVRDWEARFDLAFEKCKDLNVTLVGGVAPTAIQFGRYMKRRYGKYPKDLWKTMVMTLGSVPGINTRLAEPLKALYGNTTIREIYGATEGMFGQQMDEKRCWVPNYDLFFFEVEVAGRLKLLHEMKPGEIGSLIVSTPVLPRYRIGDVILAVKPPYFRCIGRENWLTPLKYAWYETINLNFGKL